ncbi:hypothetical protein FIBSPDRAFT_897206 [Athelia psychrophila]|uniref:Aspartic peptidase DDI1-type domain-containing protein n=1 Tax=Athelia psychrophila TaxID=1759441 RepID=A0A166CH46_9AGAM|nr:hypothetical protein FIBSPDRAFT_897206 [Fibularhizoctonia sp. CBS 109695]
MSFGMMTPTEVRLAALDEGSRSGLFAISITNEREDLWDVTLATICQATPFPRDQLGVTTDDAFTSDPFRSIEYGGPDSYLLIDRHNGQDHPLYRAQLIDPEFDLISHLTSEKDNFYLDLADSPWGRHVLSADPEHKSSPETLEIGEFGSWIDEVPGQAAEDWHLIEHPEGVDNVWTIKDSDDDSDAPSLESITEEDVPWALDVLEEVNYRLQCNVAGPSNQHRKSKRDPPVEPEVTHFLERMAMRLKGFDRICPRPIEVVVHINGHNCRALLDSGSLSDFMSTTICDQLCVRKEELKELKESILLQLACSGSSSKIHARATAKLEYQDISKDHVFNVCNLELYDLILGTPFMFQHMILLGLNPTQVIINSVDSVPIRGMQTV